MSGESSSYITKKVYESTESRFFRERAQSNGVFPSKEIALLLKTKSQKSLIRSLTYILKEIKKHHLICENDFQKYSNIIKRNKNPKFPYYAANSFLIDHINKKSKTEKIISIFDESIFKYQQKKLRIVGFGDSVFPTFFWSYIAGVMREHLPTKTNIFSPDKEAHEAMIEKIHNALTILKEMTPDVYAETEKFIDSFIILKSGRVTAGSSFCILGSIYLKENIHLSRVVEYIVHETAHQYLFHVSSFDKLCLNPIEELYISPLRKDLRPMIGVYHAVFVLARMIYAFMHLKENKKINSNGQISRKLKKFQNDFLISFEIIKKNAILTPLGQNLIDSCLEIVR